MRISHKVNHGWNPSRNDPDWEVRVEAEAERTTNATQRAYERAAERLSRAEARLNKARADKTKHAAIRGLSEVVERRRQELLDLARLMTGSPAGSQHRGRGSHRAVPPTETL